MKPDESHVLKTALFAAIAAIIYRFFASLNWYEVLLALIISGSLLAIALALAWEHLSKPGRARKKKLNLINSLPTKLVCWAPDSIVMGKEIDLNIPIYLPDAQRSRHIHIVGATGSGKTESVIFNFLRQDVARGIGSIILDAKGDVSFLQSLKEWVSSENLRIFDLSSEDSLSYDPLQAGTPIEAAQRLFSSLTWSEEYYKSKAFSALQLLFQRHHERNNRNPTLAELSEYLEAPKTYSAFVQSPKCPEKVSEREFMDLSGLRDQIKILCMGHMANILSPKNMSEMKLEDAANGCVLYFRLQSLLSPQMVAIVGKMLINHINFLAGTAHRAAGEPKLIPTYFDEFASFACPEFADLISKARSAGYALHFSHQSIGDLAEVTKGFLNQITDNSATKIVLRINDPDSADFFARSFGTKLFQKITQRVTNVVDIDRAEVVGEGTQREAHQFRASPDLFKTLPTGVGSVLIAHGADTPHGASSVFKIQFPHFKKQLEGQL